jgi:acyl-CoA hydrolase
MVVGVRVESQDITTGKKRHCNSSYFTMVAKDEDGKSTPVPGLLVQDEQGIRRFARSKYRKEAAFKRDTKFDENNFDSKEYLAVLAKENIKIELK